MVDETQMKSSDLSGCEKRVLGCIYEYKRKNEELPNLRDLMTLIEEKYGILWKQQTVCTFLNRMEKKGLLMTEKKGRYTYYYPVVPYEIYVCRELKELCNIYFENSEKKLKQFVRRM